MLVRRGLRRRVTVAGLSTAMIAGVVVAGSVIAAPPASAATGYEIATKFVVVPANSAVRTTVACPAGKVAVGGGVTSSDSTGTGWIQESAPGGMADGLSVWLASYRNTNPARDVIAAVRASCVNPPAGYEVVQALVSVNPWADSRWRALCPAGKVALGGGAAVVNLPGESPLTSLRESGPGMVGGQAMWLNTVHNHDDVTRVVDHMTVCADSPAGYVVPQTRGVLVQRTATTLDVPCPAGSVAYSGGIHIWGNYKRIPILVVGSYARSSATSSWTTVAVSPDHHQPHFYAFAVCVNA